MATFKFLGRQSVRCSRWDNVRGRGEKMGRNPPPTYLALRERREDRLFGIGTLVLNPFR